MGQCRPCDSIPMTMNNPILQPAGQNRWRVLHVGCGSMATAWLQAAKKLPALDVVGLADLRIEAAEKLRDAFAPGAAVGCEAISLMEELSPDIVFNCTVPAAHHAISRAALEGGAHVLSEKPLANSWPEALDLVASARQCRRILAVTQNYRYAPAVRTVRKLLGLGAIGRVTTATCDFFIGAHFGGFREEMEHVLLHDMAIHHFDMARSFLAETPRDVFCHEWNPAGSWYAHGPAAFATFLFGEGPVFDYRGSWCAEGRPTPWNGQWRFIGTEGTLHWDGADGICHEKVTGRNGFLSEIETVEIDVVNDLGETDGHACIIAEFVDCLTQGSLPETHAGDNLGSLAMVFSAIESAETRQVIQLPASAWEQEMHPLE